MPAGRGLRPVRQADGTTVMGWNVSVTKTDTSRSIRTAPLLRKVNGIYRLADISDNGTPIDAAPAYFSSEDVQRRIAATNVAATATE